MNRVAHGKHIPLKPERQIQEDPLSRTVLGNFGNQVCHQTEIHIRLGGNDSSPSNFSLRKIQNRQRNLYSKPSVHQKVGHEGSL